MKLHHLLGLSALFLVSGLVSAADPEPQAPPKWLQAAEDSLVGTWLNTNEATQSIPKVEIMREGSVLKIRFWGRTHPRDSPFGPPDALFVLSDHSELSHRPQQPPTIAFATHTADFAIEHFTLRLADGNLRIEGVTLFTDNSKRSNRIAIETFRKE